MDVALWYEVQNTFYDDLGLPHKAFVEWLELAINFNVALAEPAISGHLSLNKQGQRLNDKENVLKYVEMLIDSPGLSWDEEDIGSLKATIVTVLSSVLDEEN